MALGTHWEWRGFGQVDATLRHRIEALPPLAGGVQHLIDPYLWVPGCSVNIKLREGCLKFKHFVEADGDLEYWLEDPAEVHPFPLRPATMRKLQSALGVRLPAFGRKVTSRQQLLDLLPAASRPVQVITVVKTRRLYELSQDGKPTSIQVELTRLSSPEALTTVAVEGSDIRSVRLVLKQLGLESSRLCALSYLHALALWGEGKRVRCH